MPFKPGNAFAWKPGQSGNPGGRPAIADEIKALAEVDSPEAYRVVAEMMRTAEKDSVRLAAALSILKMAGVPLGNGVALTVPPPQLPEAPSQERVLALVAKTMTDAESGCADR